jgi:hypothetical protein
MKLWQFWTLCWVLCLLSDDLLMQTFGFAGIILGLFVIPEDA